MSMTPAERVRQFLDAMCAWERVCNGTFMKLRQGELDEAAFARATEADCASLVAIFDEHLTVKAKGPDRFGMRLPKPYCTDPPQYDQEIESTDKGPKESTFYVVTKNRSGPSTKFRYSVVVDPDGTPRIDDLRDAIVSQSGVVGKWEKPCY